MNYSTTILTAQSNVLMRLGDYKFMIMTAAYQELRRRTEFKWPSQLRMGLGPSSQFVGNGEDTITLQGTIFTEWRGGNGQVQTLREMGAMGEPYLMLSGLGEVMGRWIIESVEETQTLFAAFGTPRKQEFTLNLRAQYP